MNTDPFEQIYYELFPPVIRYVRLRIPARDVEDVTAEILAKVWKALPSFSGIGSLKSWALKITAHQVADYYRNQQGGDPLILTLDEELRSSYSQGNQLDQLELILDISAIMARLSESQVAVLQLRLIEGFSAEETARILGTTPQAVDSLLYRAKKSFQKNCKLQDDGGEV